MEKYIPIADMERVLAVGCMTGSIAEAFYGVPEKLKTECRKRLTPELIEILYAQEACIGK